jgi:hypothetical protein
MHRDWYALADSENGRERGAFKIDKTEASDWNKKGFGIFWTVQELKGERRKENLVKINSWAIDIDGGEKPYHLEKLTSVCYPSLVIETKNGYHAYWNAKDATQENFEAIVSDRLVPFFNADKKAKDLARILRVPGYLHQKDPSDPFMIVEVWKYDVRYSEHQMFSLFQLDNEKEKESNAKQELRKVFQSDGNDLWEKIYNLDCEQALERLSGTEAIGSERITFRRVANGNLNIIANGKQTSCWIDQNKRIGSLDGGGPTVWQWVNWYHRNHKYTYEILKNYFGELWRS